MMYKYYIPFEMTFVGLVWFLYIAASMPILVTQSSSFKEIFRDDFTGNVLDDKKWNPSHLQSEVNNELQYYTPSAVRVGGGVLKIISNLTKTGSQLNYTSGRVDTKNKFKFKYGDIEWRAKLPSGGKGIWSALWLEHPDCLPAVGCVDWPPAVSVIDFRSDQPRNLVFTVFFKTEGGGTASRDFRFDGMDDFSQNFHTYGLKWAPKKMEWLIDGRTIFAVNDSQAIPSVPLIVVMNTAVGGEFPGNPDETTSFPTELIIDYVSVRQAETYADVQEVSGTESTVPFFVAPLLGITIPIICIALVIGFLLWKRKRNGLRMQKQLSDVRKQSATSSNDTESTSVYSNYLITDFMKGELAVQHYVNLLEIPSANLEVSEHILGKGEYGLVRKGVAKGLRGCPRSMVVAVKSVHNPCDEVQCRSLTEEMKIMSKAGRHLNILNLVGAVIKGEILLLLEFCPLGNMLNYLISHRGPCFFDHIDNDGYLLPLDEEQLRMREDLIIQQQRRPSFPLDSFDNKALTTNDLISFAFQVSRGMEYLASRSIIHRDLAARNVLLAENRIVKISDFGMARQHKEYVLENQHVALPVRWMSPEAITRRVFCEKSDVWSFGVVLWEIFSLGETPYKNAGLSTYIHDFVLALTEGFRLSRPQFCPIPVYDIMRKCWELERDQRPCFAELERELQSMIAAESASAYLTLDMPYQQFNSAHQDILDEVVLYQ